MLLTDLTTEFQNPPGGDDRPTIILTAWSEPEQGAGPLESLLLGEPRHRAPSGRHRRVARWRTRTLVAVAFASIVAGLLLGRVL